MYCPNCGNIIEGNFCIVCGTKRPSKDIEGQYEEKNKKQVQEKSETWNYCFNCGEKLKNGKCCNCGFPTSGKYSFRYCAACGERTDGRECGECGYYNDYRPTPQSKTPKRQSIWTKPINPKPKHKSTLGIALGVIGSLAYGISAFLPFITFKAFGYEKSISIFEASKENAIILVIVALLALIVSLSSRGISTIIFGMSSMYLGYDYNQYPSDDYSEYIEYMNWGMGYYLLIISGIVIVVAGIVMFAQRNDEDSTANNS